MDKPEEMNQREVAEVLGVSRALVQKIEERALKKIRDRLEKQGIKPEDFLGEWIGH
jgi:DNA-directed RNA polymerase specialized sigma subunit